jgi:hypothetical protein
LQYGLDLPNQTIPGAAPEKLNLFGDVKGLLALSLGLGETVLFQDGLAFRHFFLGGGESRGVQVEG